MSKEELVLHTKEATGDIATKYGARNIVYEAPGCIGCALPRRFSCGAGGLIVSHCKNEKEKMEEEEKGREEKEEGEEEEERIYR